ncbi:MAG: rod shape-determining protein [Clostridia bacterium]|nr:rod shape-determining protein [Clostridia bacterium]
MSLINKDIGIDLGTTYTTIYLKDKGIVLKEPTVVAINVITNEVLAVGKEAKEMLGRTPDNIVALKPLKSGVISNLLATQKLLEKFIENISGKSLFGRIRAVICVPSGITDIERRAVEEAAYLAGAKEVYVIEQTIAAAIGAGLNINGAQGSMVIDIGGGITEIAVLSLGGVVVSDSIKIAGTDMDSDIIEYIKEKYDILIGENVAEEIKNTIGVAVDSMVEDRMQIKGRNLKTGLPDILTIQTSNIKEASLRVLDEIVKLINMTFEKTPPELAADIMENGITICGGGAYIKNLERYVAARVKVPVKIADNPLECVAKGLGKYLNNIEALRKTGKHKR